MKQLYFGCPNVSERVPVFDVVGNDNLRVRT